MAATKRLDVGYVPPVSNEERRKAALTVADIASKRRVKHETKIKEAETVLAALLGPEAKSLLKKDKT